jgi:hypothetical protein
MPVIVALILLGANFPVYVLVGWLLFGSTDAFGDAIDRWKKWDWETIRDGDFVEARWAELRLGILFVVSIAIVYGEYKLVMYGLNAAFGI